MYLFLQGFDNHSNVEKNMSNRFIEVNERFQVFAEELKIMGLWKKQLIYVISNLVNYFISYI